MILYFFCMIGFLNIDKSLREPRLLNKILDGQGVVLFTF